MKRFLSSLFLLGCLAQQGFSQGYYFEFKMTSDKANGNVKTWSQNGNSRSEVSMNIGDPDYAPMTNHVVVALTLKDNPNMVYMLDVDKKNYSEMDVSKRPDAKDAPDDYEVTVLGKEKVNGYNATHVKVKNKKTNQEQELWTTTEIPHFSEFEKVKSKYTGSENMTKALAAKGAEGFPVRIVVNEAMGSAKLDLVTAELRTNPSNLFSLAGYTKSAGAGGMDRQQLMQQLQNMTPEQRQQFIEQMRQQQGAPK
jgi:hypothetical protein